MKETLELCTIATTRVFKRYPEPEHDVPHNPRMVRRINHAYATLSSAHLAGHLYWHEARKQAAYPGSGVLTTKNEIGGFRKV